MNRRRSVKPNLGFGSILLLVVAAVVIASAGVFHAYIENRQVNVAREIRKTEDRISQYELDIETSRMLLAEQLNRILIRDRLRDLNSDLRPIAAHDVVELDPAPAKRSAVAGAPDSPRSPASSSIASAAGDPPLIAETAATGTQ